MELRLVLFVPFPENIQEVNRRPRPVETIFAVRPDYQFSKTTHPVDIMKWGWDSTPACAWRVDKFHEEEAMDLWRDEESARESIEWIEEENRWHENERGGLYRWGGP